MNNKRYFLRPSDALMRIDLQNTFGLETGGLTFPEAARSSRRSTP